MKKEIRVLVVEPMRKPYVKTIPDTLEAIYHVIEGDCMQVVPLYGTNIKNAVIVCNDDGKLRGLPLNRLRCDKNGNPYDVIAGTFFLTGVDGEDFCSLTDDQVQELFTLYEYPELIFSTENGFCRIPIDPIQSETEE
mgnify:FL=1